MRNVFWALVAAYLLFFLTGCGAMAPEGDAGEEQTVSLGETVTLSAADSDRKNGDSLRYSWTMLSAPQGSTAELSNPGAMKPTFQPDKIGEYVFELIVDNHYHESDPVTVVIKCVAPENFVPIADAGQDQNVATGDLVNLAGSGSDADGDLLNFTWIFTSKPPLSETTLSDPSAANPTFTADVEGSYTLTLTVDDGNLSSQPDSITITAATTNSAPTTYAGPDQNVATGDLVKLAGSGSDADDDLLSFTWIFTSKPPLSEATLSDPSAANPTFLADVDGTYTLTLTAGDGILSSQPDSITITAATTNSAPTTYAGPDQNVATGDLVKLAGSGSDADDDLLSFTWIFTSKPPLSEATLSDPSAANPTFTADVDGTYTLTLTVDDGNLSSKPDSITITAATTNSAPTANAGSNQNVAVDSTVILDGSNSFDVDDDTLSYSWNLITRPSGSSAILFDPTTASPSFTADVNGTYVVELIVNDGYQPSTEDIVYIETFSDYSLLFSSKGSSAGVMLGSYWQSGSEFSLSIQNESNISFICTSANLYSGSNLIGETSDKSMLGGDSLEPGENVGVAFTLNGSVYDDGMEFRYFLTRPDTGESFTIRYTYENNW